jgi:sarcosine oxidase subunit alpha
MNDLRVPIAREATSPFEWIDRTAPLTFTFEGTPCPAFAGDSIASALLANGQRVLGYSAKKRRARGIGANVLVRDRSGGCIAAEDVPVGTGMELRFAHARTSGSAPPDWTESGSKLTRGGLHDPVRLRESNFERSVRSWVGVATLSEGSPRSSYSKPHAFTDVLVVGGGIAGLSAAVTSADLGVNVTLVELDPGLGGRAVATEEGRRELATWSDRALAHERVAIRTSTVALGMYDGGLTPLLGPGGITNLRARATVLATGRVALPAVFRNNDLPGILTLASAERLFHRYAVRPGLRTVILTTTADGHRFAADLASAGVEIVAVLDAPTIAGGTESGRDHPNAAPLRGSAGDDRVIEAIAGSDGALAALVVERRGTRTTLQCDALVVSAGSGPADQLVQQARRSHQPVFGAIDAEIADAVWAAGSVRGAGSYAARVEDGVRAGQLAAASLGVPTTVRVASVASRPPLLDCAPIFSHPEGACFVDFDEDVEVKDLAVGIAEGFDESGLLNAYTKFGRGFDQSKSSHVLASEVLADRTARAVASLGRPVQRPPVRPTPMGALAGRRFRPRRRTPLHDWHAAHGADFLLADDWERPSVYRRSDESRNDAIAREVRAVRESVGLIDVGTLGKIDIVGPDAGAFLERVYTGTFADLRVGASRYALLCDEGGAIVDDGVVARFSEQHFYATTTTSSSGAVYRELQRRVLEAGLDVVLTNLTGAYAAVNVAGPSSLDVVRAIADDAAAFTDCPYLGVRETTSNGVPIRVLRVGFVGEIGFELHVPAGFALDLWTRLSEVGKASRIVPFGVEAQRLMRLEKGHLLVGQDTDALSTPYDVGLGWAVKMKKPSFVGKRSLQIRAARPPTRRLVGFELPPDYDGPELRECHLVLDGDAIAGRVTSVAHSPTLGKVVGLAFAGPAVALGASLSIRTDAAKRVTVRVVPTPFYDPGNKRQQGVTA